MMKYDPFTLRVALDKGGNARGELYLDDGESYNYRQGEFVWREFTAEHSSKKQKSSGTPLLKISSRDLASNKLSEAVQDISVSRYDPANAYAKSLEDVRVEKIAVVGLNKMPSSVKVEETGAELAWEYVPGVAAGEKGKEGVASLLIIRDPKVLVAKDWMIVVH